MLQVFIGYDKAEVAAYQVCSYSIIKNCSEPVSITPLNIRHLPWFTNTDYKASTEFAFTRFLVPYLCGFKGKALFMDSDMLVTDDIADLFNSRIFDESTSVSVVQHDYSPAMGVDKFLGNEQTDYTRKNWSSVMLFNNEKCKNLTPTYVQKASGLALHQFEWAEKVGSLPPIWNYLVGENTSHGPLEDPSIIHFTRGGPYFKQFEKVQFADLWRQYFVESTSVLDQKQVEVWNDV